MFRWTWTRKEAILRAVKDGLVSATELDSAGISPAELEEWQRLYERYGHSALKATRLQRYRGAQTLNKRQRKSLPREPGLPSPTE